MAQQEPEKKPAPPSPKREGERRAEPRKPFKLTENDRRFLRGLRIKPEE